MPITHLTDTRAPSVCGKTTNLVPRVSRCSRRARRWETLETRLQKTSITFDTWQTFVLNGKEIGFIKWITWPMRYLCWISDDRGTNQSEIIILTTRWRGSRVVTWLTIWSSINHWHWMSRVSVVTIDNRRLRDLSWLEVHPLILPTST